MKLNYDCIVIGAGFAGATVARELAERAGKKILVLEKRSHIGGNAYDFTDDNGILVHKYGPHIFHTNSKNIYAYLSRFTGWRHYEHRVMASVYGTLMPVPFNLRSLTIAFSEEKAARLQTILVNIFGKETKVSILELKKSSDPDLKELADYVYRNIFLYYTQKQWGTKPEDIDPSVTARVPVFVSEDDRYFQDKYQGLPLKGYTSLFENMLDHPNIRLQMNTDAGEVLKFTENGILWGDVPFKGLVIYTGAIDELFKGCLGRLPYRTLEFRFETCNTEWKQPCGTVNYTVDQEYTRITEFKHLTGQVFKNKTTIMKEYPLEYRGSQSEIPYYPVVNAESRGLYEKYSEFTKEYEGLYLLGRLAEYRYYNMDGIIEKALELADRLILSDNTSEDQS